MNDRFVCNRKHCFRKMLLTVHVVVLDKWSCIRRCHCKTFNQDNDTNKHKAKSPGVFISESVAARAAQTGCRVRM